MPLPVQQAPTPDNIRTGETPADVGASAEASGALRWMHTPRALLGRTVTLSQVAFVLVFGFCLTPWASPPLALALGLLLAQTTGNPFVVHTRKATARLLQLSVVGLGFGMNAGAALQAGRQGLLFTVASICGTLVLGFVVGRALGLGRQVVHLISCGTAICGGSAIAALGPVLRAKDEEMSVALGTVFVLNALALFTFPPIGHLLHLTQSQFGLWCAIAIHDTSSVVGAAAAYGTQALAVATTIKLARALWIIPVALGTAVLFKRKDVNITIPYFIFGFVAAMLLNTFVPAARPLGPVMVSLARVGLTVTLFFIGAGLSATTLRAVGARPYLLGALLWLVVSVASLYVILHTA